MPLPAKLDEDLFKDSTMSFGEHLDELRSALFKSVLVIAIGFVVGLGFVGNWVVQRIQDPLKTALQRYNLDQSEADFKRHIAALEKSGQPIPPELRDPEYAKKLAQNERMVFEEQYVDAAQVLEGLQKKFPEQMGGFKLPGHDSGSVPTRENLLRIFVWHPVEDDSRSHLTSFNPQETFMIKIKASLLAGVILASPAVFYFLWSFVAAGLYPHEKKYVHIFLPFSLGMFLLGAALAFFFVFPPMLEFFFSYNKELGIDIEPRISEWVDLALLLPVAFGVSFQLPLVMLFLQRIGIFTIANYMSSWRVAILAMAVIAMVITPTGDPQTMLMMLVPLTFLYFGGILLCKWMPGGQNPQRR